MDLKKFKLISAVFLAGALLFLSVILIVNKNQADNMPFSVAEDLSALFASQGIELAPEIIPLTRERLAVYSCRAADGTEAQKIAETAGKSTRLAANLTDDGYLFRLENGAMIEVSRFREIRFNQNNALDAPSYPASQPNDAARERADAFISRFSPDSDDSDDVFCTYRLTEYATDGGNTLLRFNIFINGVKIEGDSLSVCQSESEEVLSAYGKCVFSPLEKESGFKYYDIINILKKEYDRISESGAPGDRLKSVELCYLMRYSADKEKILFLPGWKIEYSNGAMRFYESVRIE